MDSIPVSNLNSEHQPEHTAMIKTTEPMKTSVPDAEEEINSDHLEPEAPDVGKNTVEQLYSSDDELPLEGGGVFLCTVS